MDGDMAGDLLSLAGLAMDDAVMRMARVACANMGGVWQI